MQKKMVVLCAVVLCSAWVAQAADPIAVVGTWQEEAYLAPGAVQSVITAGGADWDLSAEKIDSAVPGPPGWQWQTAYVNGTLGLMGLGGITDSVTGLVLTNLTNNVDGIPVQFQITGSGALKFGSPFSLIGTYDAAISGGPDVAMGSESVVVSGVLTEAWLTVEPTELWIDVKPGSYPNSVNPGSNGVLPVAVLGTDSFDVMEIDAFSLQLDGVAPRMKGKSGRVASYEDVNDDGLMDLMAHFPMEELALPPGTTSVLLTGILSNGEHFIAMDDVRLVGGGVGVVTAIPEPATLALLALGGLATLRRRRR